MGDELHTDRYYVVGVMAIMYLRHGCTITIVSKEERTYLVFFANNPQWTCLDFAKMTSMAVSCMQAFALRLQIFVQD